MSELPFLRQIDNIFTEEECKELIERANKVGWKDIDRGIATYKRVTIVDKDLADLLFKKIKDLDLIGTHFNGSRITGLNEFFRFSKYEPGEKFNMHKDGFNVNKAGDRSIMTLNIFLNDDFDGGETDFYLEDRTTLRFSCKPKPGRGALFYSQQYHCGNEVLNGYKYLIRTDVMVAPF